MALRGLIVPSAILTLALTTGPASALSTVPGGELTGHTVTYDVRADIDGHSELILSGNSAKWYHIDFAAPGRLGGKNEPTIINGTEWFPVWPQPGENRDCGCYSSTFNNVVPSLPGDAVLTSFQAVSCLDSCSATYDDGTLVIDFNDDPHPGDASYEVKVTLSSSGPIVSGYRSSLCVTDRGDSAANDTPVTIATCGSPGQDWTLTGSGTLQINGKCLDIYRDQKTNKAPVELWTCTGGANQQWLPTSGTLVNPVSGKCLDDPRFSTTPGTQLDIYTCNGGANQQWHP